jgi:hypothetical protein
MSTVDGGNVTAQQACADIAAARCMKLSTCSATVFAERYPDEATCESRQKAACLNSLAAPSTGNTPAATETCVAAIAGWACGDFITNDNTPAACLPKQGTLADGSPCAYSGQCQSAYCSVGPNAVCGTCAAEPRAGDSCATQGCGPNLNCSKANTCVVFGAMGAACDPMTQPCGASLVCVGATMTAMGVCQTAGATVGAACDPKSQTMPACDARAGLACNTTTMMCAQVTPAAAGSACGPVNSVATPCANQGFCPPAGTNPRNCIAVAADGAACDTANGPNCLTLSKCVTAAGSTAGVCTAPDASLCH